MTETNEEFAERRGYKSAKLMTPSRKYEGSVTVLSWSPVGRAYDVHEFPDGFDPELAKS